MLTRDPAQRSHELERIVREWLRDDREGVVNHLRAMPAGPARTEVLLLTLDAMGRDDPRQALTLARELVRTREERAFYSSFFAGLASQQPAAAVQQLEAVPEGESRANAVAAIAAAWIRADADAALAWAGKLPAAERSIAQEAALTELAALDPRRAIRTAQESLTGAAQQRTLRTAFSAFAKADPKAAAELVLSLPAGEAQSNATVEAARAFAVTQPREAIAWSRSLPNENLQRLALLTALEAWAAVDPGAAGKEVAEMKPGPTQMSAADRVARIMAGDDPQKAAGWAQTLPAGSARDFAIISIASTWARRDPAEAVRWASELPAGDTRTQALGSALSYWTIQDAPAAQKFVTGLKGDAQTHAATTLAPMLAQANPKAALEWTRSLPAPEPRDSAVAAAFNRWRELSPTEAEAWLKASNLPAATKAKLQKKK